MGKRIRITAGSISVEAELNDTETARKIWDALPITGVANRWGDEIYFRIPVRCEEENPREVVDVGDLGYWRPGSAFCIFFGPTPASRGNEIRPASPVNVFGKVIGDATVLRDVKDGDEVKIEPIA
ncbi:MAG: cyclophilin-like fold protein [Armatimonadota bacterium]|nr:cyclophilin-like fold protein [Armatimonadota bacterium]MCX7776780.1 cyclophilin-like fold protein [Armatimonadota bacterium]MDW8024577.1 cyclophilin-like fold protein [Armatimonadota bacterium]